MNGHGKTFLITGGNTGIGKATATSLARTGAQVVFTARNREKGERALADIRRESGNDNVACMHLDLAALASIREFAEAFLAKYPRLDVLVLNAGLMVGSRTETADGFEMTFGVNHLGHFALTGLLLGRLKESEPARIVVVSSDAHRAARGGLDFADLQARAGYAMWTAYGRSKLANLLFTLELAERLQGSGVTVNALHPGVVATDFGGAEDTGRLIGFFMRAFSWAMVSTEKGARTSVYLATAPEVEGVSGLFYARCKPKQPRRAARNREMARRLWQVSEELTGVRY